ncbi:MAG: hypothetical protein AABW49_04940 [Nanoarchaeota archaeon]
MKQKLNETSYQLWRQDECGNRFLIESGLEESDAEMLQNYYRSILHDQYYWIKCEG